MERYKELKVLGKGSFGRAVLAQEKSTGIKYVMKVIHIAPLKPREREEALTEAKILSKLKHPYIVGYHESFADTRYLHIVMEYADAGDLTDAIKRQKMKNSLFPEDQIWDWFVQICMALKHVHDRKILHRDLKTQNIFLCTDENDKSRKKVKLGDFGIAKILQSTLECARTAIGTPYYLSPELCEDKPYNNKSDIWSLGCVLYEICTLQHAFEAQNMKGLVVKILRGQYQPISSTYSRNLRDVLDRMLQKDPNKRPSVNQILRLPFLQDRIKKLLPEDYWNEEFSHTIIHGRGNALVGFGAGRVGIPGKPVSGISPKDDASSEASGAGRQPVSRHGPPSAHPPPPPSQQNKPMYFNPNGGYQPPAANQKLSAAEVAAMAIKNNQRLPPPANQYQSNVKQPGIMPGAIAVGVPGAPPVVQVNNKLSYDEIVRQEKQRIEEQRRRYQEEQARIQEKAHQDYIRSHAPQQAQQENRGYHAVQGNPFAKKPAQQASGAPGVGNAPSADMLDAKFADLQDFINRPLAAQQPQPSRQPQASGISQSPTRQQQQQQQRDQVMRRNIEEQRRHQQEVKRQLAPAPLKEQAKDARERELMEAHNKVQKQKEEQERRIREAKEKQRAEWEKKNREYEKQMEEKRRAAQTAEDREKERLFRISNGPTNAGGEANPSKGGMESLLPPKVMDPGVQNRNDPRNHEERTEQQRKLEEQRDAMRRMIAERRREQELKRGEQRAQPPIDEVKENPSSKGRRLCDVPSVQAPSIQPTDQNDDKNALACLDEKDSDSDFEDPYFNPNAPDGNGGPGPLDKAEKAANMMKMLRAETTEESISQRMERLRILLEGELGLTNFVKAYQYIRTNTEQGGEDDLNQNVIVGIIGETNVGFINTIVSLIYCEDRFNTVR